MCNKLIRSTFAPPIAPLGRRTTRLKGRRTNKTHERRSSIDRLAAAAEAAEEEAHADALSGAGRGAAENRAAAAK